MPDHIVASLPRRRAGLLGILLAVAAGGGGDGGARTTGPSNVSGAGVTAPAAVTIVSGSGQTGGPGTALASPLVVRVTTAAGKPVVGATVSFQVTAGQGTLSATSAVTDAAGQASTQLTLGAAGAVQVVATVQGTALATAFSATSSGPIAAVACTPAEAAALAPGQATTPAGSSVCVAGGAAGAEFTLIPFNTALDALARTSFTVLAAGVDPAAAPLASRAPSTGGEATADVGRAFEARLRARDRAALRPLIADARAWRAARDAGRGAARRNVIPRDVQVGQLYRLNANGDDACTNPDYRPARVEAVSNRAIVVADTTNPPNGFVRADYQHIAATFDTLIDVVALRNFGPPGDIDANGRAVLFYTSAVNALTPRNSSSYVGGFFTSRDLFPTTTQNGLRGCAASNLAEMFYLLVPDPGGMINGNRFSRTFVTRVTLGTVAHEYEHLINTSRRLYVNTTANDFEETWLDEGLAHVAEELVFFQRAGLGPRLNIDAAVLRASPRVADAFTEEGISNFDRLSDYLVLPSRSSPYADDDSLSTRGAAWAFLRYAADQVQPTGQEALWQRLVNSTSTGMGTLQAALGADLPALFRDWGTSLLLDDVAGADARYQFPSWNLRSVYAMSSVLGGYPLRATALTNGTTTTLLSGGGAAYLRFAVGAGQAGAVTWNARPAGVSLTLVRLR